MSDLLTRVTGAVAERYSVDRIIGTGGMSTVFAARDQKHSRDVALKVLHPELAAVVGPERFLREIEIIAGLDHPHILPMYDSGEVDGLLYYVMPQVGIGQTSASSSLLFEEWIRARDGASRADEVQGSLGIPKSAARAEHMAHQAGLRALILSRRLNGVDRATLEAEWLIEWPAGLEERWRDELTWLLRGVAMTINVGSFYRTMREVGVSEIDGARKILRSLRQQAFDLRRGLPFVSPLGDIFLQIRNSPSNRGRRAGLGTLRRLEAAGIGSRGEVRSESLDGLRELGVEERFARQILDSVKQDLTQADTRQAQHSVAAEVAGLD